MVAALLGVRMLLGDWFEASAIKKIVAVGAMVGTGLMVYFPIAWIVGGMDKEDVMILLKRKRAAA